MNKLFLLMVLFTLSMSIKAQDDFFEQKRAEYKYATPEEKAKIDSLFSDFEEKLRVKQVKSICGIEFGSTYEVAERISQNKFGLPEVVSDRTNIFYKNIKYAGLDFSSLHLLFQSDGTRSYFNACIFIKDAKTFNEAKAIEKEYAEGILKKYEMITANEDDVNPTYGGGISPLWDGHWYNLDFNEHLTGVHTDIIKYDSNLAERLGYTYGVRIIYGPFNFVKEEF